jgi:hypothetical protein
MADFKGYDLVETTKKTKKVKEKKEIEIISTEFNPFAPAKKKKVAICGTAPTLKNAPFDNPDFDIWGVAHCCFLEDAKRLDVIFEIHDKKVWIKDNAPFQRFPNALIYFQEKDKDFPNSQTFPVSEILKKYSVNKGFKNEQPYMSSSLPFMVALAIEQGYEEIHTYGIHLLMEEEYFYQRPCLERYLGIAEGKGIKVYSDPGEDIMNFGYVYGLQEIENDSRISKLKARLEEFDKRLAGIQNQLSNANFQLNSQLNQLQGAREQVIYDLRDSGVEMRKGNYVKF